MAHRLSTSNATAKLEGKANEMPLIDAPATMSKFARLKTQPAANAVTIIRRPAVSEMLSQKLKSFPIDPKVKPATNEATTVPKAKSK